MALRCEFSAKNEKKLAKLFLLNNSEKLKIIIKYLGNFDKNK